MAQFIELEAAEDNELQHTRAVVKDRQWDARFNSLNEDTDADIVAAAKRNFDNGRLRFVLIGGPEIGENPKQDDYCTRHVHVCIVLFNPLAKSTVASMFGIKRGYYLKPRNRVLPLDGWIEHHTKKLTKISGAPLCLYRAGELPADTKQVYTLRSETEKKRKVDECLVDMYDMLKKQKTEEEIFKIYPRNWVMYGEKVKSMLVQRADFFKHNGDPHIWLYGGAGTGKTSLLKYIYPHAYKKNLYNRFFDLYNPREHDHVILEDLDHAAVEQLTLNFIKTMCDESGFTYDQKYKSAQPARTTVLVTSQFSIQNILDHLEKQIETGEQGKALRRRFYEVKAGELQRFLGVKLRTNYELNMLKQDGNNDPGKCFMSWNYLEGMPGLKDIPSPEECQKKIREEYYSTHV